MVVKDFVDQICLFCYFKELFNHMVCLFQRGLVLEHRGFLTEARVCFENAVAVNPAHTKSLYHLVSFY